MLPRVVVPAGQPGIGRSLDVIVGLQPAEIIAWHSRLTSEPDVPVAAALGTEHVAISTALLGSTATEGELAFVLSQQVGHLVAGHHAEEANYSDLQSWIRAPVSIINVV